MSRLRLALLALILCAICVPRAWAWGCTGHEVVALIALKNLQALDAAHGTTVAQQVEALLATQPHSYAGRYCTDPGLDPIAYFATWADDHRTADPSTAPWHFWDIPLHVASAAAGEYCAQGCVIQALQTQIPILQDKNADPAARVQTLMFVIHFMGDMHQPLHEEDNNDRGGNCVPVTFLTTAPTAYSGGSYSPNLHGIWDTELVETIGKVQRKGSGAKDEIESFATALESSYSSRIQKALTAPIDLVAWANHAHAIAVADPYTKIAPSIAPDPQTAPVTSCSDNNTSTRYFNLHETARHKYVTAVTKDVKGQLALAGARLANVLYNAFNSAAGGSGDPSSSGVVFRFAVSGDSRNCGDIVMPAIASAVRKSGARFYWHLGDYRAIYDFDEDMVAPPALQLNQPHLTISSYLSTAWPDFIKNQLTPFGDLPLFLAVGNHETIPPKDHAAFLDQFGSYFNTPPIQAQREQDHDTTPTPRTWYHLVQSGADFLTLDNASNSTFDDQQMAWIRARLAADREDTSIKTIVVGMHEALPGSVGLSHSMCDSALGIASGREVYNLLWDLQSSGKHVYVLASHSHFVVDDAYRTPYWGDRVLPGWIVGTAGAVRYRLPPELGTRFAHTDVYGYLLASVMADGSIHFEFQDLSLDDLRLANAGKNPDSLVGW